jgi:hypothetical protein
MQGIVLCYHRSELNGMGLANTIDVFYNLFFKVCECGNCTDCPFFKKPHSD